MFLSLGSTIDHGTFNIPKRIGCFSYGSGCCSEFYSGVVTRQGQERQLCLGIEQQLNKRRKLTMEEYNDVIRESGKLKFVTRNIKLDFESMPELLTSGGGFLFLEAIKDFHRQYRWIS